MPISIKREKRRNKYFLVARENGKIQASRKWSPKSFSKENAIRIYKSNNTFNENIKRRQIKFTSRSKDKPYYQFVESGKQKREISKPRKYPFRYFFEGRVKGTKKHFATSSKTLHWRTVAEAKAEAFVRFRREISRIMGDDYDEDKAIKYDDKVEIIDQGVKYEATLL